MKNKTIPRLYLIGIVSIAIIAGLIAVNYIVHRHTRDLSASQPGGIAAKVPDGWYEHMIDQDTVPPSTAIVLTKHAALPARYASDGQYDDPQITIRNIQTTKTPEQYVEQDGLSGENAERMGIKGTWSTLMGHRMFIIELELAGHVVLLFGGDRVYTFSLSASEPQDRTDFEQVLAYYAQPELYAGTDGWKTYADPSTGFTMQYPAQYAIEESPAPPEEWGSRSLMQVYDPSSVSTGEFQTGTAHVTLLKQPVNASGEIYHSIAAYQKGVASQMVQGSENPEGDLVTIASGERGLFYTFPANPDTGAGPADMYFFIKDDLIYEVSFDANDPNEQNMLGSIAWR